MMMELKPIVIYPRSANIALKQEATRLAEKIANGIPVAIPDNFKVQYPRSEWVAMSERQPMKSEMYLVFIPANHSDLAFRGHAYWSVAQKKWEMRSYPSAAVTHWAEFPADPI